MANDNPHSFTPLFEKVYPKNTAQRLVDFTVLFLLFSLLTHRVFYLKDHGLPWFLGLLCETWFTVNWLIIITIRWTPLEYKTYPEILQKRVNELPAVDMFLTTADPVLEPPIITVNTVLSLLAVDYPANKLACYVSDDGCSPLNFYALVEGAKFAKLWVPFCKKYNVQVRAPFKYFSDDSLSVHGDGIHSSVFLQEWRQVKEEYEQLTRNIEAAAENSVACVNLLAEDFAVFKNTEPKNHLPVVKIIWENKESIVDGIPHLIYISREKRTKHQHYYKAGAMNALTRVSGVMTNAPFMLNVDCDMFANNPLIILHAMCLLLGCEEKDCGFAQFPQLFHNTDGDSLTIMHEFIGKGIVGIQGPFYQGSGGIHRRKIIYGLSADNIEGSRYPDTILKGLGSSEEFITSAARTLKGEAGFRNSLSDSLDAAHEVIGSTYEHGTIWGEKVGWMYGSSTEDVLTGLVIQTKGWRSGYCNPVQPGFLGCSPTGLITAFTQQKRWATGLLEIFFSKYNPITATLTAKLMFRQCLAYLYIISWGLRPIPELCYAALPAYCIITNSNFLPKESGGMYITISLFMVYKLYTLSEFIQLGFPVQCWWICQCSSRIISLTSWIFGFIQAVIKLLGLSPEIVFEITKKELDDNTTNNANADASMVIFDESPSVVVGTRVVLVQLTALVIGFVWSHGSLFTGQGPGFSEYFCSVLLVLYFWPFVEGLFRKGKYGIPLSVLSKSVALVVVFVCWSKKISIG